MSQLDSSIKSSCSTSSHKPRDLKTPHPSAPLRPHAFACGIRSGPLPRGRTAHRSQGRLGGDWWRVQQGSPRGSEGRSEARKGRSENGRDKETRDRLEEIDGAVCKRFVDSCLKARRGCSYISAVQSLVCTFAEKSLMFGARSTRAEATGGNSLCNGETSNLLGAFVVKSPAHGAPQ